MQTAKPGRLKIVHAITRMVRGGADENTLLSCNVQAEEGHEVHLIYGRDASESMLKRAHPGVQLHRVPSLVRPVSPIEDVTAVFAIARLLRAMKPDVVHTHTSKAGIVGRMAALLAGCKGIVHGVHILPFLNVGPVSRLFYILAEKAMALVTDAFVDVSSGMRDACLEHRIGNPSNHYVVPSGMDIESFLRAAPLDEPALVEAVPDARDRPVQIVLMVAALEARKRIVEFLDVFSAVSAARPDARLVVLGEGVDRPRIERAIREQGLVGKVHLAGFRSDVERWIARADVCVLSSEREGLPRAVVQYAAGACPCVVTDLPGVDVVVKHGHTGYLVDCAKLQEMAKPVIDLLSDASLAHSMREQARRLDLLPWSVQNMTSQLDSIYRTVLSQK